MTIFLSWCFTSTETVRLIRDGRMAVWKREIIIIAYLSVHCHHQNDSCIKTGSDVSHFNVLLTVKDKVTRQCPQTTFFEGKGQPKRNRAEALLLTSLTPYRWARPAHKNDRQLVQLKYSAILSFAPSHPPFLFCFVFKFLETRMHPTVS